MQSSRSSGLWLGVYKLFFILSCNEWRRERYRDLLQASTSIIAIAKSSKCVLEALEESKDAIVSQDNLPPPPQTSTAVGVDGVFQITSSVFWN